MKLLTVVNTHQVVEHLVNNGTSIASGVAIVDFADRSFTGVTLTARGALIYNTSAAVLMQQLQL
jgi:hypothetical protein